MPALGLERGQLVLVLGPELVLVLGRVHEPEPVNVGIELGDVVDYTSFENIAKGVLVEGHVAVAVAVVAAEDDRYGGEGS